VEVVHADREAAVVESEPEVMHLQTDWVESRCVGIWASFDVEVEQALPAVIEVLPVGD
jgi:hypothetical protein